MDMIIQAVTSLGPFVVAFAVLRYVHRQQIKREARHPLTGTMAGPRCSACGGENLLVHRGEYVCMDCENEGLVDW